MGDGSKNDVFSVDLPPHLRCPLHGSQTGDPVCNIIISEMDIEQLSIIGNTIAKSWEDFPLQSQPLLVRLLRAPPDCKHTKHTLFDQFCAAYPKYHQSKTQFVRACAYLAFVVRKQPYSLHQSLWDDWIRFYCDVFEGHFNHCKYSKILTIAPFPAYYLHVKTAEFTRFIINQTTLPLTMTICIDLTMGCIKVLEDHHVAYEKRRQERETDSYVQWCILQDMSR